MKKESIVARHVYEIKSGTRRQVTAVKGTVVWFRLSTSHQRMQMPLSKFAREAVKDVTVTPKLALAK